MKALVCAALMLTGCTSLQRLPGLESPHSTPSDAPPINADDFTVEGVTAKVDDVVYVPVKGRMLTVDVQKPGAAMYVRLTEGYTKSYVAFLVPGEGIRFWNGSTPKGSRYRIHSFKN